MFHVFRRSRFVDTLLIITHIHPILQHNSQLLETNYCLIMSQNTIIVPIFILKYFFYNKFQFFFVIAFNLLFLAIFTITRETFLTTTVITV